MALNPRQKLLKQQTFGKLSTADRVKQAQLLREGLIPDPNAPKFEDKRMGQTTGTTPVPSPRTTSGMPAYDPSKTLFRYKDPNLDVKGKPVKGVFTNPTTGAMTDQWGNPVDSSGKPITGTTEEPIRTYEQIGESLANQAYDVSDLEKELYGDTKTETSMDKYFKNLIAEQDRQSQRTKESLDYQQAENIAQGAEAQKQIRSGTEAQLAQLMAGGREGVTGGTLGSRLKEVQGTQLARLEASAQESQAQIEDVKAKLAVAEREGRRDLVNAYQQQLDAYTVQAQESEANLLSALTAQSEEERAKQAQQGQNIASFQSLVESGTEMDYNTISSLASQYGLPTDMLMGYYQGAQSIRDDKALSLEEKQVALNQAKQDLQDQVNGLRTTQAQNIAYLDQLRQMGASEEIISAFKSTAGITDYDDPLTQAELLYQQLENQIKQKQMNGEPVSVSDYETLFDLKQKMDASTGTGGTAYVSPSIDGISMTYEGGQLNVTLPTNPDGTLKAYQCGEFVNRAWGLSAGGANGFGSTSANKQDLVSRNGFFTEGKSFPELLGLIKPGMAFASYAGETDHTGLIISAPDAQGNYMTLEANVGDNNPNVSDPPIYKTRNIKDQDVYGFVYPPNGQPVQGATTDNATMQAQALSLLQGYGGTADERSMLVDQMMTLVSTGQAIDLTEAKKTLGFKTDSDKTFIASAEEELKEPKKVFTEVSSKLDSLPALLESETGIADVAGIVNFLKTIDPNSVARESEVASVQNAVSLGGQIEQISNRLASGKKLTDDQRAQLLQAVQIIKASTSAKLYEDALSYQNEFKGRGLEFTLVTDTFLNNLKSQLDPDQIATIEALYSEPQEPSEEDQYLDSLIDYSSNVDVYDYIDELTGGQEATPQTQGGDFTQTSPNGRPTWMQNIYSQFQK